MRQRPIDSHRDRAVDVDVVRSKLKQHLEISKKKQKKKEMTVEVAKRILSHQIRLQNATTRIFAFDFGQKKN